MYDIEEKVVGKADVKVIRANGAVIMLKVEFTDLTQTEMSELSEQDYLKRVVISVDGMGRKGVKIDPTEAVPFALDDPYISTAISAVIVEARRRCFRANTSK